MAAVYRAEDRVRGWLMAIKVMKAHQLGDAVALERFRFLRYVPCVPMAAARST